MLSNHTRRLSPAPGGERGKLGHGTHKIHLIYSYSIHSYIGPSHHMFPLQLLKEDEHLQDVAHLKFIKLLIHDENNGCSWLELVGPNGFQGSLSLCVDVKWLLPTSQGYHKCLLDKWVFLLTGFPKVFYTDIGQNFFQLSHGRAEVKGFFLLPRNKFKCGVGEKKPCLIFAFLNKEIMVRGEFLQFKKMEQLALRASWYISATVGEALWCTVSILCAILLSSIQYFPPKLHWFLCL